MHSNALCQQAADMAAEQLGDMDKLYDCKNVYAALSWTRGPRAFEVSLTLFAAEIIAIDHSHERKF